MNARKLIGFAVVALALACGGKKGDGGKGGDSVKWPEKPADGAPVVGEFIEMTGEGEDMEAKIRFFNFTDKSIDRLQMTLHYLDGSGKELDDFPYTVMQGKLIDAKGHRTKEVGAFIPKETKKVTAEIREVQFTDGTTWSAPQK